MNRLIRHFLHEVGGIFLFLKQVAAIAWSMPWDGPMILRQIGSIFLRSLLTVAFAGAFVGAILALQFDLILAQYDARSFLGGLTTSAVVREIGPLIISFLLAGKIGSFTAAELATMRVSSQIDALECLGYFPLHYLVIPRLIGITAANVLLLATGLLVSVVGGMAVASRVCGVNYLAFLQSIPQFVTAWSVFGGLVKSFFYGIIVAVVSCYHGYTASGGARGVGQAVTLAAVYTNLFVLLANFFIAHSLTIVLQWLEHWGMA